MLSKKDVLEVFKYWEENWLDSTWLGEDLPNLIETDYGVGLTNDESGFLAYFKNDETHSLKYKYKGLVTDWMSITKNDFSVFEI